MADQNQDQNQDPRDPFRSERLIYRAVRTPGDNALFAAINDDRIGFQNSNFANNRLPGAADAERLQNGVAKDALMGAVICLAPAATTLTPSPGAKADAPSPNPPEGDAGVRFAHDGVPIGQINLKSLPAGAQHHRHSEIAIDILPEYQGKGYGGEAIRWALGFAFRRMALHRVKIRAFGWNEGAIRLYERIGFKVEGRMREELWHEGRWWDGVELAMLDREWFELQENAKQR